MRGHWDKKGPIYLIALGTLLATSTFFMTSEVRLIPEMISLTKTQFFLVGLGFVLIGYGAGADRCRTQHRKLAKEKTEPDPQLKLL